MKVKMKPDGEIIMDLGLEQYGEGHKFFASECKRLMNEFVPYSGPEKRSESGHLRDSAYVDNECNIHYSTPYAGYQYYGMRKDGTHIIKNWTTPGTGPYWDQLMVSAKGEELKEEMNQYIKERGTK